MAGPYPPDYGAGGAGPQMYPESFPQQPPAQPFPENVPSAYPGMLPPPVHYPKRSRWPLITAAVLAVAVVAALVTAIVIAAGNDKPAGNGGLTDESATTTATHGVILTDAAAAKAKALLDQEGRDDLALRIAVQPGGCAGLRYNLFFDDRTLDGDLTGDFGGVTLTVDRMSAPYVQGATIDFVDTIEKQGFTIDNPNATGSCACGDSFN